MVESISQWIIVTAAGCLLGWLVAHDTISTECDKLGSFYVGSKTYTCARK